MKFMTVYENSLSALELHHNEGENPFEVWTQNANFMRKVIDLNFETTS